MTERCLFISAYLPSSDVPAAGNRMAALWLEELESEFLYTDVISFYGSHDERFADALRRKSHRYHLIRISTTDRVKSALLRPLTPSGVAVRQLLGSGLCMQLLKRSEYDHIVMDFSQSLEVLPRGEHYRAEVRVHDVMQQLYARHLKHSLGIARMLAGFEYAKAVRWEKKAYRPCKSLVAISDKDAVLLEDISGRTDIRVEEPQGYHRYEGRSPATIRQGTILFWGNMARPENVDAALYFYNQIFPEIKRELPSVELIIAGANPADTIVALSEDKCVTVTGFVESPEALFLSSEIAIAPLRTGAGVKIKVLELLGSGVPVIASPVGAEGVREHQNLHVAEDAGSFAQRCIEILQKSLSGTASSS